MKLIIGLGNPGKEYENTRHNIGFMSVQKIYGSMHLTEQKSTKFNAFIAEYTYNNEKILFVRPLTFMNLSGETVEKLSHFYKVNQNDIIIIHDDMDLPVGNIRIRKSGSSGGHNGLKSIISLLGSEDFIRIRVGIGKPELHDENSIINHVLSKFKPDEKILIDEAINLMPEIINTYLDKGIDYTMNIFNKRG